MSRNDNKRLVRQHIELTWNRGHMALAEQLHSKDFLYKSSFAGHPMASPAFAAMVAEIRSAMPDLEVVVEECIAEGDKVLSISAMAFWTLTPAQQIREICTIFDMESFRAQLGLATRSYAEKALP